MSEQENVQAVQSMDHEHQIQIGLVDALCQIAGHEPDDSANAAEILAQLLSYSSAHFMSEELLMRLASYDGYKDHVAEHIRMMDVLDAMLARQQAGDARSLLEDARAIKEIIARHIDTYDLRFAESATAATTQ